MCWKSVILNNKNNQGRKQPVLDLRHTGQVGIAQLKTVVLTEDAWWLFQSRCREMNDDEFHIIRTTRCCIEFSLTDRDGKPQQYHILAKPLERVKRATGKRLLVLFLVFEKDGCSVVTTDKQWFEPIKPWLRYWAGKGVRPLPS